MLTFLFLQLSPRAWVLVIAGLFVFCLALTVLFCLIAFKMTTRPDRRYPAAPAVGDESSAEAAPTHGSAALVATEMHPELRSVGGRRVSCDDRWAA